MIKIKLFNNFASYSVNEDLIDLKTANSIQNSPLRSSPVPMTDTHVCNNNNNSIQNIPSPLSDTVSPQQTPVTLKSLNKSYSDLY